VAEILEERAVSSRNRRNPRGVKRKMSNFPLRRRGSKPMPKIDLQIAIKIFKVNSISLGLKKLVRNIFLTCVGLKVIGALAVSTTKLTFIGRVIYMPAKLAVTRPR
jgi:hypothetical protein